MSGQDRTRAAGVGTTGIGAWILAIDTATDQSGVALFDGECVANISWPGGRRQTTTVLPMIERMLHTQGMSVADIGAVAVAAGPGSFTGLRVGLSLAKGLAITGDCAVVGIGTLEIAAAPLTEVGKSCLAVVPAGRNRVVWAVHDPDRPPGAPVNTTFEDLLNAISDHPDAIVVGELTPDQLVVVRDRHKLVSMHLAYRRPEVLARLGFARWRAGDVDDPVALEPLYLHGLPNPR